MEFTEQKLGWGNDICNPTSRTLLQQFNYRPKSLRLKKKKKKKAREISNCNYDFNNINLTYTTVHYKNKMKEMKTLKTSRPFKFLHIRI